MDTNTIATELVCAWLRRTEVDNMGSGETAAREIGEFIAWVFGEVAEGLEARESTAPFSQVHRHPARWPRYPGCQRRGYCQDDWGVSGEHGSAVGPVITSCR